MARTASTEPDEDRRAEQHRRIEITATGDLLGTPFLIGMMDRRKIDAAEKLIRDDS